VAKMPQLESLNLGFNDVDGDSSKMLKRSEA
jgi:hypothetical protein